MLGDLRRPVNVRPPVRTSPLFTRCVSQQNVGTRQRNFDTGDSIMWHRNARSRTAMAALSMAALFAAGCAPDAMTPRSEQTGYDGFLTLIASRCNPLMLGSHNVGQEIQFSHGIGDDSYDYFLDITSRLYFGQISPASYRGAVQSFFGPGDDTNRGIDCILANLPSVPPPMPAGPAKKLDQL
jgi:hypothetical protein